MTIKTAESRADRSVVKRGMALGDRLHHLRWTYEDAARATGFSKYLIYALVHGERPGTIRQWQVIVQITGMSWNDIE